MHSHSLRSIVTAAALIVTAGVAAAANITEIKTYQSTISTGTQGGLNLKMEANYNNAVSNAPLMVMLHQYSGSTGLFDQVRPNAQAVRDQGFFVITVAMRGREGSDGVRDSGGLEIYDIYDAVEAAKAQYGNLINPDNINISGYSGGGGNTMSALTKFPDYFRTGSAFYGMSDYGYDLINGWYNNGATSGRTPQLDADVGNPNSPTTALITSRYLARASNFASRNNPYSEIHFFVDSDEPICPPINDTSYRNKAIAAARVAGEFNNITLHTGQAGTYHDFNGNGINESNEQQYWPHSTMSPDQQQAGISWYISRVLNGSIPAPVLNASDNLYVAGFVRTKKFSFFVGDGQNGAGSLIYSLTNNVKSFTFHLLSPYAVTGKLTVDTADMSGQTVNVLRNGVLFATFTGGGTYQVTGIANNETVRLALPGTTPTLTEDMKARFAFEGNAQDTSGNGLAATATAVSYTTGKIGPQAAQFNGTSSYVAIPSAVADDFTVAMWVKTTDTAGSAGGQWWSGKALVDGEVAGGAADWGTAIVNGKFVLGVGATGGDVTTASSVNVNDGTWHHVLATRNATTGATAVYVDGVLKGSGTGPTGTRSAPPGLRIGSLQNGGNFFNGTIDDVRLYDWALSATEIMALASGASPTAPTGVMATPGNGSVTLSWTAPSTATGYYVKRATTSGGPYTTVAAITGSSYLDAGLTNGTTYYYVVSAANTYGEGANSTEASTVPSASGTQPSAPTGLMATPGDASVALNWTAPSTTTGYNVKRATTSGGSYTTVATPTNAFYLDTGLTNGTTYYYVVTATNIYGESASSTEASAAPIAPAPADLTVNTVGTLNGNGKTILEATGNSLNVTTFASNIATAFASDTGGVWNFDGAAFNISSGATIALKYGTSHTKSLVLTLTEGSGGGGINQNTVAGEPTSGTFLLGLGGNGATRTFTPNRPLLTVGIFNTDRNDAARIPVLTVTYLDNTTASTSGANADNVYFHGLSGSVSNPIVSFAISQNNLVRYDDLGFIVAPLSAPHNVAAAPGSGKITLSWNAVFGATDYTIQRASSSGGIYANLATGVSATNYMNTGLADGATWYYTVTANGAAGLGTASAPVSATTYTTPQNWRLANFGTIASTGNAADSADPDGDGFNNAKEYASGTNPNDASSLLKISQMQASGNDMLVSFPTVIGKNYRVERSNTLQSGSWTSVQDNITGTGGTLQIPDTGATAQFARFYRIVVW